MQTCCQKIFNGGHFRCHKMQLLFYFFKTACLSPHSSAVKDCLHWSAPASFFPAPTGSLGRQSLPTLAVHGGSPGPFAQWLLHAGRSLPGPWGLTDGVRGLRLPLMTPRGEGEGQRKRAGGWAGQICGGHSSWFPNLATTLRQYQATSAHLLP